MDALSSGIRAVGATGGSKYRMIGKNFSLWFSIHKAILVGQDLEAYLDKEYGTPPRVASRYGSPEEGAEADAEGNVPAGPLINAEEIRSKLRVIDEWRRKRAKVFAYLLTTLDEVHLQDVAEVSYPWEIIQRFTEQYASADSSSSVQAWGALADYKMRLDATWLEVRREFEALLGVCKRAGLTFTG